MAGSSKWLPIIGIIGLACLALGVYSIAQSYIYPEKPAGNGSPIIVNAGKIDPQISIPFTSFDPRHTKFVDGPKILKGRNGNDYLSMGKYGTLAYTFRLKGFLKSEGEAIWIKGTFSSELSSDDEKRDDPKNAFGSDIKLWVNGTVADVEPIQRANSDTGYGGGEIVWVVDVKFFKEGNNLLEFQVPNGPYAHGLAVWEDFLIQLPRRAAE
jgi:hypothetical protein